MFGIPISILRGEKNQTVRPENRSKLHEFKIRLS